MCLETVSNAKHRPDASGVGWKVFVCRNDGLHSWLRPGQPYEINQWYETYDFSDSDKIGYWRGFHIFKTRLGARRWSRSGSAYSLRVIRKVRWKYRLATGMQPVVYDKIPCIVAKEILILPQPKDSK